MTSLGAKATLALWVAAIIWDVKCPEEQTISESLARGIRDPHTRLPVSVAILMTVTHFFALAVQKKQVVRGS